MRLQHGSRGEPLSAQSGHLSHVAEPHAHTPAGAGAILQSRVSRLVYGARQPRLGADGSWVALFPEQPEQEKTQPTNTWLPLLRAPLAALREAWGAISLSSEPPVRPTGPHPFHASIEVSRGVLVNECSQVVKDFFRGRRRQQQQQQQRQ
jgi:tRNA(adenine34) deaminase